MPVVVADLDPDFSYIVVYAKDMGKFVEFYSKAFVSV